MYYCLSTLHPFATIRTKPRVSIRAMRAVVQRVPPLASRSVEGRTVSEIGPGLLVLVGLHESDSPSDAEYICRKVLNMRSFTNETTGKGWDQNVMQMNYQVLLVSQFTLYGTLKGNKPDFHVAMAPDKAKPFYASLVDSFRKSYKPDAIKGRTLHWPLVRYAQNSFSAISHGPLFHPNTRSATLLALLTLFYNQDNANSADPLIKIH